MKTTIKDHTDEVNKALDSAIQRSLIEIGLIAEGNAKVNCPVDTGRLRNSITNEHDDTTVYVGTNVEYATHVEIDDTKRHPVGKSHFIRDSIATHIDEYRQIFDKNLSSL